MKRIPAFFLLSMLLLAVATSFAQMMPPPGPELKKLDYFSGTWSMDGDVKPGPMGPGGKATGTSKYEWMEGKYFMVSQTSHSGVMGEGVETAYYGYDANKKIYTYDSFSSVGEHNIATATLDGDTWTWLFDANLGAATAKGRFVMKTISPTSYTYKLEFSQDGTNWVLVMDGKATKK
jgi:hypothetical protein